MITATDLYPLVDALGFGVTVDRTPLGYGLQGDCHSELSAPSLKFKLQFDPTIVESTLLLSGYGTSGVLVHVVGAVHVAMLLCHNRNRLESFVLDGAKLDLEKGVFGSSWSRSKFMAGIAPAVVAHHVWQELDTQPYWQETPKAPKWVRDYLTLRDLNFGASTALEKSEMVAFGLLAMEDVVAGAPVTIKAKPLKSIQDMSAKGTLTVEDIRQFRHDAGLLS